MLRRSAANAYKPALTHGNPQLPRSMHADDPRCADGISLQPAIKPHPKETSARLSAIICPADHPKAADVWSPMRLVAAHLLYK